MLCYCGESCPRDSDNGTCVLKENAMCYAAVEETFMSDTQTYESVFSYGCFGPHEHSLLQCKGDLVPSYFRRSIKCCNSPDLCNKNLRLEYHPRTTIPPPAFFIHKDGFYVALLLVSFTVFLVVSFALVILYYFKVKKPDGSRSSFSKCDILQKPHHIHDYISSSGSGVGKPLLVQSTIGREVETVLLLGEGQFSEVWLVRWDAKKIIMKVFHTLQESRWQTETNICQLLRHENIIGMIGVDIIGSARVTFMDYHENGTLQHYLKDTTLNCASLLKLAYSAANGLSYLHSEIVGTLKRPEIVHRNITSSNILINSDKECVIANFEIAMSADGFKELEPDLRLGTPRYMAPEIVNGTIDIHCFDAFKYADVYSFGLVLWEMCRRCTTIDGKRLRVEDYTLPYSNVVLDRPKIEDMRMIFSKKKLKHDVLIIPPRWQNNSILKQLSSLMQECWYENASARATALRIRKFIRLRLETLPERKDNTVDIV